MSKLDGNVRWGSKLLLTEHHEKYNKAKEDKTPTKASVEEIGMIRDWIMYPHMLTICDNCIRDVRDSSNIFRPYFIKFLQIMMDKISRELNAVRKELRARNIKIYEDETTDGIMYHRYTCRGYQDRFGIVREHMRSEISDRLAKYAASILKEK